MDRSLTGISIGGSPLSPPNRNDLTGQKMSTLISDLTGQIQKWSLLLSSGNSIITEIAQLKVKFWDDEVKENHPEGLDQLCDQLDTVVAGMQSVVDKMERIKDQMVAVAKLDQYQQQRANVSDPLPLFITWPADRFGQVVDEIREAYDKELRLKRCVAENVAHCNDRETINLHKIAWVYQIYLPASVRFNVESLLAETSLVLHPQ